MDLDSLRESVRQLLGGASLQRDDVMFVALLVAILAMLVGFIALRRGGGSSKLSAMPGFDRLTGLQHRIEKLEVLLGEQKLQQTKQFDAVKGDFQFLRRDIEDIRKLLKYAAELKEKKRDVPRERDPELSRSPTELDIPRYAELIDEEIEESKETAEKKSLK